MKYTRPTFFLLVLVAIAFIAMLSLPFVQKFISRNLYGNIVPDISCEKLPTNIKALEIIKIHRDDAIKLVQIGIDRPGVSETLESIAIKNTSSIDSFAGPYVSLRLQETSDIGCGNKSIMRITAGGTRDFENIKQIIGETFHGIPYQIDNV
jgi:hypothetical protein